MGRRKLSVNGFSMFTRSLKRYLENKGVTVPSEFKDIIPCAHQQWKELAADDKLMWKIKARDFMRSDEFGVLAAERESQPPRKLRKKPRFAPKPRPQLSDDEFEENPFKAPIEDLESSEDEEQMEIVMKNRRIFNKLERNHRVNVQGHCKPADVVENVVDSDSDIDYHEEISSQPREREIIPDDELTKLFAKMDLRVVQWVANLPDDNGNSPPADVASIARSPVPKSPNMCPPMVTQYAHDQSDVISEPVFDMRAMSGSTHALLPITESSHALAFVEHAPGVVNRAGPREQRPLTERRAVENGVKTRSRGRGYNFGKSKPSASPVAIVCAPHSSAASSYVTPPISPSGRLKSTPPKSMTSCDVKTPSQSSNKAFASVKSTPIRSLSSWVKAPSETISKAGVNHS